MGRVKTAELKTVSSPLLHVFPPGNRRGTYVPLISQDVLVVGNNLIPSSETVFKICCDISSEQLTTLLIIQQPAAWLLLKLQLVLNIKQWIKTHHGATFLTCCQWSALLACHNVKYTFLYLWRHRVIMCFCLWPGDSFNSLETSASNRPYSQRQRIVFALYEVMHEGWGTCELFSARKTQSPQHTR